MDSVTASMASLNLDVDTIRTAIVSLPQELYDKVYVATFTAPAGSRYPIRTRYGRLRDSEHPPENNHLVTQHDKKLMQISHESREIYARTYYGKGNDFRFFTMNKRYRNSTEYVDWLKMVSEKHCTFLPTIVVAEYHEDLDSDLDLRDKLYVLQQGLLLHRYGFKEENVANVFMRDGEDVYGLPFNE